MLAENKKVVVIASRAELTNPVFRRRLWMVARNLPFSRRQWADKMAHAIYGFDGVILSSDGRRWPLPDIDDVMGDDRWLSYYFKCDADGNPLIKNVRLISRLQLIKLYLDLDYPNLSRHIGR